MVAIARISRNFAGVIHYFLSISLGTLMLFTFTHAAEVVTPARPVERIQVNTTATYGYAYYLYNPVNGWGAPGCESAQYVLMAAAEPGSKELLMLATVAQTTGKSIYVFGECLNANYMRGKAIQIAP